ncbi:hypothetical protein CBOM_04753 [Ceraceosorus bombacis]|uniref:Protein-S-isoprenylcysteine O-methyltransferase n=1 Tax=Ceraceosorus bombacis TaxID=401625 RepID=A0A0P1BNI7_9BASI|nr:hypothetical protein CBOM_04753 [Ceraceosorus bombacis]
MLSNLDFAIDALSVITASGLLIAGTTPPARAPSAKSKAKKKAGKAEGNGEPEDLIRKLGLTSLERLFHALLFVLTALHIRSLWRANHGSGRSLELWVESKDQGRYRLACALVAAGGAGRLWCYQTLGKSFTFDLAVQSGQKVITTGPYAFVRHPSYTAILVAVLGASFLHGPYAPYTTPAWRLAALILAVVNVTLTGALVVRRMDDEERMMLKSEQLGKDYLDYMVKTPSRLWPTAY